MANVSADEVPSVHTGSALLSDGAVPASHAKASGDVVITVDTDAPHAAVDRILHSNSSTSRDTYIEVDPAFETRPSRKEKRELKRAEKNNEKANIAALEARVHEIMVTPLKSFPRGYPLQAAFQSSQHGTSIYRAFRYLHARVILELQDEIRCLEDDLAQLDELDNDPDDRRRYQRLTSRAFDLREARRSKQERQRTKLLADIRDKLLQYDEMVMRARDMNTCQKPTTRDYLTLRRWFAMEEPLSYVREDEFIKRKEDLITLRPAIEWGNLDGWIETCLQKLPFRRVKMWFVPDELRGKTDDDHIRYWSSTNITKLSNLLITIIVIILLVLPVIAMFKLTSEGGKDSTYRAVAIMLLFTLLFSISMSLLTKARRHELFAASAAYCAVLVVFIGNFSGKN